MGMPENPNKGAAAGSIAESGATREKAGSAQKGPESGLQINPPGSHEPDDRFRRMLELLREKNELWEGIFSNLNFLIAYLDTDFNFIRVNRAYAAADAREVDEFPGKNHFDLYPSTENEAIFRKVLRTGEPYLVFEKPFTYAGHPERGVTYWDWGLYPVKEGAGDIVGLILTLVDVTERRRAQAKIRFNEWKYRHVFESVPAAVWELDISDARALMGDLPRRGVGDLAHYLEVHPEFRGELIRMIKVVDVNRHARKLFGAKDKRTLLASLQEIFFPETVAAFSAGLASLAKGEAVFETESAVRTLQGAKREVLATVSFPEPDSEFRSVLLCVTDITDLKRAQEAVEASQELLDKTFASLEEAVYILDASDRSIVTCNAAMERIFGYRTEELIGRDPRTLHVNEHMFDGFRDRLLQSLASEGRFSCEYRMRRRDGSAFFSEHTVTQICDDRGERKYVVSVVRDVSERKRTEEALRTSEARLRRLSASLLEAQENERARVARELHDSVGGSLSGIKLMMEATANAMEKGEALAEDAALRYLITEVEATIEETRRISRNLRPSILDNLGLVPAVRSLCKEVAEIRPDLNVRETLDIEEEDVPQPLGIVLYRLCQEALNNVAKHSGARNVELSLTAGKDGVALNISDDGDGFDLKEVLEGNVINRGMGLKGMKERCELSGGHFSVISAKGKGTIVRGTWRTG